MTKKGRKTRHQLDQVGCFKRIFPVDDSSYAGFQADIKALHLYEALLGFKKGQGAMTLSAFSKLTKAFGSQLQRTRIELLFRRVVRQGNMDLSTFYMAL